MAKRREETEVTNLKEDPKYLQNKLKDLVIAYKSLLNEKEAIESAFKAVQNAKAEETQKQTDEKKETGESSEDESKKKQSTEVTMLMNSLTALSIEKSRMEASFQADKKQLRQEKEKYELTVRDLQDKLKTITFDHNKDVELLKSSLIIEKHEREKEHNDYQIKIRELETLLVREKEEKVFLENSLSELASKKEVNRFKEIDITEKFVNLQEKHLVALEQERKKVTQLETDYREIERAYENRVASLENRIAELSTTLVRYNRNKQQDQNEIIKLKNRIVELSSMTPTTSAVSVESATQTNPLDVLEDKNEADVTTHVRAIKDKLQYYENLLLNANEYCEKSLKHSISEEYKPIASTSKSTSEKIDKAIKENKNEIDNLKVKVRMLTDQNSVLSDQLNDTINKYERQMESLKEQQVILGTKYEHKINDLHVSYRAHIMDLELQVQKQRDRTLALLEEKEQEVSTLKSSFQIFVPGKHSVTMPQQAEEHSGMISQLEGVLAGTPAHKSQENPHILHYAHELARRDVVINNLRKNCCHLENALRDLKKELIMIKDSNDMQVTVLNEHINRLERCQSREGANLEYLKNVIVNYLYTKNSGSKRHMLNAIAAVLKLTDVEMNKIKNAL